MKTKTVYTIGGIEYERRFWVHTVELVSKEKHIQDGTVRFINGHLFFSTTVSDNKGLFSRFRKTKLFWRPVEMEGVRMCENKYEKILARIKKSFSNV